MIMFVFHFEHIRHSCACPRLTGKGGNRLALRHLVRDIGLCHSERSHEESSEVFA